MLIGDPDGSVDLYNAGTRVFITTANGADVLGTNFDVDNSLLTTEARITALNSVGGARLLVSGTTAGVTIAQTTAGGVWEKNVLSYVRDGAVSLWYNGAGKLNTTLNGIEVPGTQVDLNNSGLTTPTLIRARNSEGGFEWRADAGQAVLRQTNSGGTIEDVWIACNANSSVNLSHNGITKLSTTAEGVDVLHTAGALFDVVSSGVSTDAILGLRGATNGGARYYWDESTSTAFLRQTTPSGNVEDIWVEMVKNGEVSLHYNGVTKLSTLALGAQLLGVAGSVLIFDMDGSASSAAASLSARNIEGGYDLGANGGGFLLQQTASSGALEETWISGVEDGLVGLYHNGVEKFVTDAAGVIVTGHFEQTSMSVAPVGTDEFYISDGGTLKSMSYNESAKPVTTDSGIHTFADTDVGTIRLYTGGTSTHAWTMNTAVGQTGCAIIVINDGTTAGPTLTAGTATIETSALGLVVKLNGTVALINIGSNVWKATGDLEA